MIIIPVSQINRGQSGYSLRDESSRVFRDDIIHSVDYDILALCETFLRDDQVIELDNYKWIGHNRLHLAQNAARGSGGVGLLVKTKLLEFSHALLSIKHLKAFYGQNLNTNLIMIFSLTCVHAICHLRVPPEVTVNRNSLPHCYPKYTYV